MPVTLTAEVERVTYENEATGFRVVRLGGMPGRGPLPAVGHFPAVGPGARVRVEGDLVVDPRHGEQLRVRTLVPVEPDTIAGLERYLASGLVPGIGPGFARRIVEAFGLETLSVLDEHPERLRAVAGLGAKRAEEIGRCWADRRGVSSVMLLLQKHGASPALAARIHDRYGERSARVVQEHPYRLALDVPGVGFKTADRLARSLGIAGDHPERVQAGVGHVLELLAEQGHTAARAADLVDRVAQLLVIDPAHVGPAIDVLWAEGRVVVEGELVFSARLHAAERRAAAALRALLSGAARPLPGLDAAVEAFERRAGVVLAAEQRAAIEAAAREKVVVVTGGPGVGKTTLVRAILSVLDGARLDVRLAAPTGRAAKRLAEATGRAASTLHRLLEYDPRERRFGRSIEKPLACDAVIVDEASMIDVELAAGLLEGIPVEARVVIVGDADQLPSVGPGAVLRDVIQSGAVPTVRLARIFRQGAESRIVTNAHAILRGDMPESSAPDDAAADFFIVHRTDGEEAARTVVELVTRRIPQRFGLHPRADVQVLAPMHRGPAGTVALNEALQAALNPTGPALTRRGVTFRPGDKVMQTRNDYEREIFNGDIGVVTSVDPATATLVVRFDDREVRAVDVELDSLSLAYATSIHKSQGSEYPAVVVPLLTSHFVMLTQNLLYTAVTRARRLAVLVADPRALRVALAATRRDDRLTRLAERLAGVTPGP